MGLEQELNSACDVLTGIAEVIHIVVFDSISISIIVLIVYS